MKIDRHGKAEPLTKEIYPRLRNAFIEPHHQLMFDIAYHTGERWGAIVQLKTNDVYDDRGKPRKTIVYRKATTKQQQTREVPVHPNLALRLNAYQCPTSEWLFPSHDSRTGHISIRAADAAFRRALDRAGLSDLGYSLHSTRRGLITALNAAGKSIKVIQAITGHASLAALSAYIEVSDEQKVNAIAAI
jgi:integrase/recombinase XerD